jgi:hypothetical protein
LRYKQIISSEIRLVWHEIRLRRQTKQVFKHALGSLTAFVADGKYFDFTVAKVQKLLKSIVFIY